MTGVDEIVLSLYAKCRTIGEISAYFEHVCGASVSKETVSRITDKVIEEMKEWAAGRSPRLRADLHRRDRGEDPRRAGHESAHLTRQSA